MSLNKNLGGTSGVFFRLFSYLEKKDKIQYKQQWYTLAKEFSFNTVKFDARSGRQINDIIYMVVFLSRLESCLDGDELRLRLSFCDEDR
jgi:hypothetical protein